jgi:hypothetical protein
MDGSLLVVDSGKWMWIFAVLVFSTVPLAVHNYNWLPSTNHNSYSSIPHPLLPRL